jgi:hypothetical protein
MIYAMQNFSEVRKPWDRRGEIYVRYGEPAHKSRWDNVRFEYTRDVVTVKERLLGQLPGSARREIVSRSKYIRQSVRDWDPESGAVSDFVGVEFELDRNRRESTPRGEDDNERQVGATYGATSTSLERFGSENILGLPLFPVEPDRPWEYWIYPYVGNGVEIVFVSLTYAEDFEFPSPPVGRAESSKNAATWTQRRPENVVASSVKRQGDLYEQPAPVIDYLAASADFQGDGKKTRVELYYGIPLDGLSTTIPDTGRLARGLAVFDMAWKPLYRSTDTIRYLATENSGKIAVTESALALPPGEYMIGTQFQDVGGRSFGASYQRIEVERYVPGAFQISDIELASEIFEDYAEAMKGGLGVIPNPTQTYRRDKPVLIYYEVYGLERDDFGQTRYEVTYLISPSEHEGKFLGNVLRSIGRVLKTEHKETVVITTEQAGYRRDQSEYLELDVSKSKEGKYDLAVTVTDQVSQKSVTKQVSFWIIEAE